LVRWDSNRCNAIEAARCASEACGARLIDHEWAVALSAATDPSASLRVTVMPTEAEASVGTPGLQPLQCDRGT
jgi:hypothetical protein